MCDPRFPDVCLHTLPLCLSSNSQEAKSDCSGDQKGSPHPLWLPGRRGGSPEAEGWIGKGGSSLIQGSDPVHLKSLLELLGREVVLLPGMQVCKVYKDALPY